MTHKPGTVLKGIRTLDDILLRCVIEDETGCWRWTGCVSKGVPRMWCTDKQHTVNSGSLLFKLKTGRKPPTGLQYYPRCENRLCVNPEHRALGTRSTAMKARKFRGLEPAAQAKITRTKRSQSPLTEEQVAEIRAADAPLRELGRRYGVHLSSIWRIKHGMRWAQSLPTASVFTWRP